MLGKLNHYGFRGITNEWFRNYLTNRTQYLNLGEFESSLMWCTSRVGFRANTLFTVHK